MKFYEALQAMMEDGKRIRRKCWVDPANYWEKRLSLETSCCIWARRMQIINVSTDMFSSDDWEIVPETTTFSEAVKQLDPEKNIWIRRTHWDNFHLGFLGDHRIRIVDNHRRGYMGYGWASRPEDFTSTDWIVESY